MQSTSLSSRVGRSVATIIVALLAVLLLPGPANAMSHAVQIQTYAYSPAELSVQVGDTVTWTNHDSVGHDVTVTNGPVSFKSPLLAQGQSWTYTFTTAGDYSYICSVHPDMKAMIIVAAAPVAAAPAVPATTAAAAPARRPSAVPSMHLSAPAAAAPAASAPAPVTITETTAPAANAAPTESFNPLLLVGGAILAILVFCLLLIVTRRNPAPVAPAPSEPVSDPDELATVARIG